MSQYTRLYSDYRTVCFIRHFLLYERFHPEKTNKQPPPPVINYFLSVPCRVCLRVSPWNQHLSPSHLPPNLQSHQTAFFRVLSPPELQSFFWPAHTRMQLYSEPASPVIRGLLLMARQRLPKYWKCCCCHEKKKSSESVMRVWRHVEGLGGSSLRYVTLVLMKRGGNQF